jgi:LacI family transcriptional regulator
MGNRKRPPTMDDVAKRAGVSQTTVSFVLNHVTSVTIADETKARVWSAAKELGYRPNAVAKGLRTRRTHIIGLITDTIAVTPFAGDIIRGAQEQAWQHNKLLLIINTGEQAELQTAAVEVLLERQVEGIIYATMYHRAVQVPPNVREVPVVLLDCYTEDRSLPSVVPDEVGGALRATQALLAKGHRRIGLINVGRRYPASIGRLQGYREALTAYDVAFDETLVRRGNTMADSGYGRALELMALPEPPTALFCATDRMAMGAYDALRELGRRIPDDVAVVGFDNQELIAAYLRPPLTTLALPHYAMGQWAVQHLLQLIDDDTGQPPLQHTLACEYIARASV